MPDISDATFPKWIWLYRKEGKKKDLQPIPENEFEIIISSLENKDPPFDLQSDVDHRIIQTVDKQY